MGLFTIVWAILIIFVGWIANAVFYITTPDPLESYKKILVVVCTIPFAMALFAGISIIVLVIRDFVNEVNRVFK